MADLIVNDNGSITIGNKKKKKKTADLIIDSKGNITVNPTRQTDIAPVKTTSSKDKKRTWFSGGAFSDGYDFGDVTKTILGTAADAGVNLVRGVSSAGEGLGKLAAGGVAEVSDWIGQDDYADKLRNRLAGKDEEYNERQEKFTISPWLNKASDFLDDYSLIGERTDDLGSSVGNLGAAVAAQTVGVPWWVTMGGSSAGQELENAYRNDATSGEAWTSAVISGASEILFEKLSGGIKFGGRTLDEGAKRLLSNAITNKTASTLTKFGFDMVGEGTEEVLTELTSNLGRKLTYLDEKSWGEVFASEEALDSYLEAFIGGAVMGGGFNAGRLKNSIQTGRDYDTGLTQNEQSVVDREIESRIAEAEQDGTKLTKKEKITIENQVKEDLQKGYISTDTIESTLGGDTYNQYQNTKKEISFIENKMKDLQKTVDAEKGLPYPSQNYNDAAVELSHLEQRLAELKGKDAEGAFRAEMSQRIGNDNYLKESYNEQARKGQVFQADLQNYDVKQRAIIQKAIDSGILNNTRKTHEFVEMVAKLSADKGIEFNFANNEKLKQSGFAVEGKSIDGFVNKSGITLNVDSNKALNKVVGHEITHVLEGTELYTELQKAVKEYATTKGVWNDRIAEISERYKNVENVNVENELTSDLVGEYLFTDTDFVNNLSATKPNVFKKIYDEIKYLLKVATAGSKEARQLERVKKAFDKAYKQNVQGTDADTKYSFAGEKAAKNSENVLLRLEKAQQLEQEGNKNEEIRQKTGWFKGSDGKWRIEISDRDARIIKNVEANKTYKLNEILQHDKLFEAYPELKNHKIVFKDKKGNGSSNALTNSISLNNKFVNDIAGLKGTLMHEIQHAIQKIEGFARGTYYDKDNVNNYLNSAGEQEARNVKERINYSKEQIKEIAPTLSKQDANRIHEVGLFKKAISADENIRYSLSEKGTLVDNQGNDVKLETSDAGTHGTLMAIHNLSETKLKGILELGGFPVPSIAIMNPSTTDLSYGNISVLFDKNTIDPANKQNEVFGSDVYSPRFPQTIQKVNEKALDKLNKYLGKDLYLEDTTLEETVQKNIYTKEFIDKFAKENNITVENVYKDSGFNYIFSTDENVKSFIIENDITFDKLSNDTELRNKFYELYRESSEGILKGFTERKIETFEKAFADNNVNIGSRLDSDFNSIKNGSEKLLDEFATEKALRDKVLDQYESQYTKFLTDKLAPVFEDKYIRNNKELFTPSGNRRSFKQLYNEYTLDNVVKEMKGKVRGEEGFFYGSGNIRSQVTPQFKSIADIKANESKLVTNSEMEAVKQDIDSDLNNLSVTAKNFGGYSYDSYETALNEIAGLKKITSVKAKEILSDYGFENVPDILVDKSIEFLEKLKNAPTEYFEAKPQRAVGLDEIQAIVVPNNINAEIKQQLLDKGLNVVEYDSSIEGDKRAKINQFDDLKFSLSNSNEEIAPTRNNVYGDDVRLQTAENVQEKIDNLTNQVTELIDKMNNQLIHQDTTMEDLPYIEQLNEEAFRNMDYDNIPITDDYDVTGEEFISDSLEFLNEDAKEILRGLTNESTRKVNKLYNEILEANDVNEVKNLISDYADIYDDADTTIKDIKKVIRETKIDVSNLKNQVTDYNSFRKSYFGKLKLANSGVGIDTFYQELVGQYPAHFDSDITTEADMLEALVDFVDQDNRMKIGEIPSEYMDKYAEDLYNLAKLNKFEAQNKDIPFIDDASITQETELIAPVRSEVDWDSVEAIDLENARQLTLDGREENLVTKTKKELRKALLGTETSKEFILGALDNAKNRSMALMNNTDTIRNTELVFGRAAGKFINEIVFQPEIDNEARSIAWQNKQRQEIKDLGIKARSKESSAVQKYGEKQYVNDAGEVVAYGDAELASEFKDVETQNKIKNAAKEIRKKYDNYIDEANNVLTKLGFDPIPKRKDYMRHFQELNDAFSRYGIPFNAQSMTEHTLPTDINGLTEFWSPQKNYFANIQPRKGVKTTYDAITGIDGYISGISNLIFHTEDIQRGRAFEELIRETYGEDKGWENLENLPEELQQARAEKIQDNHLSNYAAWVHEWTNNVAGKKSKIDRSVEAMFGRKAFSFLDGARKQVGSNMIGLNLSSSLTNLIAPVQAASKTNKLAVLKGTADTIKNIFVKDNFMEKNNFLTSRMGTDMLSKNAWQKMQDAGFVFMKGMDWFSSNQIVRSKYYELRAKGMSEAKAHSEAGKFAARILGDRTKGANAQLYNSKLIGLVTQFQLEVNNQLYSQFYDTYHESKEAAKGNALKTAAGMTFTLGQLFAFTHLFGKTFEAIAGYNPTFDVISMLATALGWGEDDEDEETTTSERLKKAADQLVDALPYVNILTGGGRIPVASGIPNLVGVATGGKDEYGNELTLEDEMKKLLYLIPPTGGNQFKKTTQGLSMFDDDLPVSGSYTDSGNLRFPVEDTPLNRLQAGLFGQWSNKNAGEYFDNERQPLKEKQIQEYADLDMPIADYWKYRDGLKEQDTIQEKFDYINGLDVTDEQKNIMINNAIDRKEQIDISGYDDFGSYEEFDYATKNPEKYNVITQIDTFDNYNRYKEDIASIKDQFSNDNGYTTKERKAAVQKYIQSLSLDIPQKIMLEHMAGGYSIKDYENYMFTYIESLSMTAEEKQAIHNELFD